MGYLAILCIRIKFQNYLINVYSQRWVPQVRLLVYLSGESCRQVPLYISRLYEACIKAQFFTIGST